MSPTTRCGDIETAAVVIAVRLLRRVVI